MLLAARWVIRRNVGNPSFTSKEVAALAVKAEWLIQWFTILKNIQSPSFAGFSSLWGLIEEECDTCKGFTQSRKLSMPMVKFNARNHRLHS
jgi:hypothetical protein